MRAAPNLESMVIAHSERSRARPRQPVPRERSTDWNIPPWQARGSLLAAHGFGLELTFGLVTRAAVATFTSSPSREPEALSGELLVVQPRPTDSVAPEQSESRRRPRRTPQFGPRTRPERRTVRCRPRFRRRLGSAWLVRTCSRSVRR